MTGPATDPARRRGQDQPLQSADQEPRGRCCGGGGAQGAGREVRCRKKKKTQQTAVVTTHTGNGPKSLSGPTSLCLARTERRSVRAQSHGVRWGTCFCTTFPGEKVSVNKGFSCVQQWGWQRGAAKADVSVLVEEPCAGAHRRARALRLDLVACRLCPSNMFALHNCPWPPGRLVRLLAHENKSHEKQLYSEVRLDMPAAR